MISRQQWRRNGTCQGNFSERMKTQSLYGFLLYISSLYGAFCQYQLPKNRDYALRHAVCPRPHSIFKMREPPLYAQQYTTLNVTLSAVRHEVAVITRTEIARVLEPQVFGERELENLGKVGGLEDY